MHQKSLGVLTLIITLAAFSLAQNTTTTTQTRRTQTTRRPSTTSTAPPAATEPQETQPSTSGTATTPARARRTETGQTKGGATTPAEREVRETFDFLLDGIRKSDVGAVMTVYWNSPRLTIFNNNGTVTKTWEQVRSNRASAYPKVKDVKLDVRDVRVQMLGPDAALVTCLWTQSQTVDGAPESATGRLTLVFRHFAGGWKVVHAHTSPDRPDPSLLLPSERTEPRTETTTQPQTEATPATPRPRTVPETKSPTKP